MTSSKDPWDSLTEKYGQKNGILLSKLRKCISNLKQGDMNVTEYHSKLQKLMSELETLESCCNYKCDFREEYMERISRQNMIQFSNGLNDKYESISNQILLIDPLPSMSKAYSRVLKIV